MEEVRLYRCPKCDRTVPVRWGDRKDCPYCGGDMYRCD